MIPNYQLKRQNLAKVNDGFQNVAARMGYGPGQVSSLFSEGSFISTYSTRNRPKLDAAYRGNWIVGQVVDCVAEDMTSAGITITGETDPGDIALIQKKLTDLGIWNALTDNKKWARLYGGSVAVIQIDGQELESELRIEAIGEGQFLGINVYDRWVCVPDLIYIIDSGMDMGLPEFYTITGIGKSIRVHHSRVIRDIGIKLPYWEAVAEQMWGESVVERMEDRLMAFDTATSGAANLVNKAYLRTISVDGLRSILSAGGIAEDNLVKMFHYVRLLQSSEGLTIIDKNDEFATNSYSFAGLPDLLSQFGEQLSGATGIPLVRLFGQSPSGFSNGESDLRNYYDKIHSLQESTMRQGLTKILHILHKSELGTDVPDDFDFKFNTLWQLSEAEKADIAEKNQKTVSAAIGDGTIDIATGQKELKQMSETTGVFSNITDEMIKESENAPPPAPTQEGVIQDPNDILGTTAPKTGLAKAVDMLKRLING